MEMQSMTEDDCTRMLDELDRLLNDPDVALRPVLIWRLLDKVSEQDLPGGTMLSQIVGAGGDNSHADVQRTIIGRPKG
jgi:hypothetical protein